MNPSVPAALVLASLLFSAPDVAAQVTVEQIPPSVEPGLKVTVVAEDGRRVEGRVDSVTENAVRISARKAAEELAIGQIVRIEQQDSLKNGALLGFGLGAAGGVIGGALEKDDKAKRMIIGGIGNGLIWMAFGILIDQLNDNRRVLYERGGGAKTRIGLAVGRESTSAVVSVTW
jgi:hypothetical protein